MLAAASQIDRVGNKAARGAIAAAKVSMSAVYTTSSLVMLQCWKSAGSPGDRIENKERKRERERERERERKRERERERERER